MRTQIFSILDFIGFRSSLYLRLLRPGSLVILNFHLCDNLLLSHDDANDFFNWLSLNFITLDLSNSSISLHSQAGSSHKPFLAFTIDDGSYAIHDRLIPFAEKFRFPFLTNIISSTLVDSLTPVSIRFQRLLADSTESQLSSFSIPGYPRYSSFRRRRWILGLQKYMLLRSSESYSELVDSSSPNLCKLLEDYSKCERMLSAHEIRALPSNFSIGNHSFSHLPMNLQTFEFFKNDFLESCNVFAARNIAVQTYAFPFGLSLPEQVSWLFSRGVTNVLLTGNRASSLSESVHSRIDFSASSVSEARFRASAILRR